MGDKVRINLYIGQDLIKALKKLAEALDVSYAELIRSACRDYVIRNHERLEAERRKISEVK